MGRHYVMSTLVTFNGTEQIKAKLSKFVTGSGMVYLSGFFVRTFGLVIITVMALNLMTGVEAAAMKIVYKKPISYKPNTVKEKRSKPKADLNITASTNKSSYLNYSITTRSTGNTMSTPLLSLALTELSAEEATSPIPTLIQTGEDSLALGNDNGNEEIEATLKECSVDKTSVEDEGESKVQDMAISKMGQMIPAKVSPLLHFETVTKNALQGQMSKQWQENADTDANISIKNSSNNVERVAALKGQLMLLSEAPLHTVPCQSSSSRPTKTNRTISTPTESNRLLPCTCGVFLTSQIKRGVNEPPQGSPIIVSELERVYPCNSIGQKQCQTKCLETMVQHLPNSANILCATLNRDCRKERAYLFIKNCRNQWRNTNVAAGREYCCHNGQSYPCPLI